MGKDQFRLLEVYERARRHIASAVRSLVRPADVEDILQEAFLRCYESNDGSTVTHPQSYLYRTAINLAINHSARAENRVTTSLEALDSAIQLPGELDVETQLISRERLALYCGIVSELPSQCRRAFILKKVYGLSQREIAKFLGISENTVEKHIAKGILVCARKMTELDARGLVDRKLDGRTAHG
jgi:RNA polymerase sigma-70 factor (ECF subfamily)